MDELREMLIKQLQDAYSAERQAIQGMKRTLRKVTESQLKQGIEAHIAQSEDQRERVQEALEQLGGKPGRKVCEAMRGLVEEAQHELEEHDKGSVLDLVIVASQQRIEHYEIAAYGTMVELSRAMGETEVADLLSGILAEEKMQDEKLTQITRGSILPAALGGSEDDRAMAEDAEMGHEGKSSQGKKSSRRAAHGPRFSGSG